MKLNGKARDLLLDELGDEFLVVLAKECGFQPAESALLLRYKEWSARLITQLARRRGLTSSDTEDAMQDAVFGILKAIARYDTYQILRDHGCCFRSFLTRVLTDRFKDFVKHLWRVQNRFGRPLRDMNGDGAETEPKTWSLSSRLLICQDKDSDPAQAAATKEILTLLRGILQQLTEKDRGLAEKLMSGMRLRLAATHMGISYDQAKRCWRKLRKELAIQLGEPSEPVLETALVS